MLVIWHAQMHKGGGSAWGSRHAQQCQSIDQTRQPKLIPYPPQLPNPTIKTKKGIWGGGIPWSIHQILGRYHTRPKAHRIAYKPR